MFALLVAVMSAFLFCGWQVYKQYANQSGSLLIFLLVFCLCVWIARRFFFEVRDGLRTVWNVDADYYLDLLLAFGEVEDIVAELDKELDTAPFLFEKRDGTRYFFITDNWIINFDELPNQFLYKISNINYLEGIYPEPRIPLYSIWYFHRPFLQLYIDSKRIRIPSYSNYEMVLIYNHLRKHRIDLTIKTYGIGELYFNKLIEKADREENS